MYRHPIALWQILSRVVLSVALVAFAIGGCGSQQPVTGPPAAGSEQSGTPGHSSSAAESGEQLLSRRLASARRALEEGRYEISRQILADVAAPGSAEVQFLQARIAFAQEDSPRALFYLKRIFEEGSEQLDAEQLAEAYRLLARLSYQSGDLDRAYRSYLHFLNLSGGTATAEIWLRLAQIALLHRGDAEAARIFLSNYLALGQARDSEGALQARLAKRLSWETLRPGRFGLNDANISALQVDGDDLWIGTWNGGISRYSVGQQRATVFETGSDSLIPRTVRTIEVTPTKVWIGTYQGLYQYTKASSIWQKTGFDDEKVEALRSVGDTLYVGTLGQGLWRSRGDRWERISRGGLPGNFVNCLEVQEDYLLIGTLTLGLAILDLRSGRIFSFDEINPSLPARNVIALLGEDADTLWIGTYGDGLYRWKRRENTIDHFSRTSGEIADDWVLCAVRTDSGLYFGTFGGGVSRFMPGRGVHPGFWERIGLRQGLSALDISCATYAAPNLYFGTLGSGISILDESLVLSGPRGIQ
jgi:tetratricopeptide (TPR) repeat protein